MTTIPLPDPSFTIHAARRYGKRVARRRALRIHIDGLTAAVIVLSLLMVQILFFSGGWIIGVFAGQPAPLTVREVPRSTTPERIVAITRPVIFEDAPSPLPARLAPPVAPFVAPVMIADIEAREYSALIRAAAVRHGLSPLLIAAVARVESDFDPTDVSNKGARGLMQVMPETGRRFGVSAERLFDPERNIAAGSAYLAWLLDRYDGDLDLALAAYNAGEGAVDQYRGIPPYRETQTYVKRVRSVLARLETKAVRAFER
jgi:hypothetical protein